MNKNRPLTAWMAGCLILFFAAALAVRFGLTKLPEKDGAEAEEQIVSLLDIACVAAVKWSGGTAPDLRLERGAGQEWICPDRSGEALDQEKAERAVAALCQVVSSRRISDWEDASVYGLDPPERQVEITLTDGAKVTYQIGSLNSYTNRYYFRMEGEPVIHLVGSSVGEPANDTFEDYARPAQPLPSP